MKARWISIHSNIQYCFIIFPVKILYIFSGFITRALEILLKL